MSGQIDQIKLQLLANSCQVTLFDLDGGVKDSCNSLFQVNSNQSVFDQFDFLKSMQEAIVSLPKNEPLEFPAIEWNEGFEGLISLSLQRISEDLIQWVIMDKSVEQETIREVQQARNESSINQEFLEIQRRYLEMERELLSFKNEELERTRKFKEQFFAEVSHEMRTPLNSISGLITLLNKRYGSQDEDLNALRSTSNHLNAIINDVLDLSKLEAGKFKLDNSVFNLKEVVQAIKKGLEVQCKLKGIELKSEIGDHLSTFLNGDDTRLSQILYNLSSNAIKFTDNGFVGLKVDCIDETIESLTARFEVSDSGKGITPDDLKKIMEPYEQSDNQSQKAYGGTGLGLSVSRQLVELMGGDLELESQVNKGTQAYFILTFKKSQEATEQSHRAFDFGGERILLIEDDPISIQTIQGLLESVSASVNKASSLKEASALVKAQAFDLIISDINLQDGKATDFLKEANGFGPVLFVSGDDHGSKLRSELPISDFMLKPIEGDQFLSVTSDFLQDFETDLTNLKKSTYGDAHLLGEIVNTIKQSLPEELSLLLQAIDASDEDGVRKVLHKIKPSVSYLGVPELAEFRNELFELTQEPIQSKEKFYSFRRRCLRGLALLLTKVEAN